MTSPRIGANQTALITGASMGIGKELAACFAGGGFDLVLVARSGAKLKELGGQLAAQHNIKTWALSADLSQPGSVKKIATSLRRRKRAIDVLVNCAGVLEHGAFADIPASRHQTIIDLNVSALTELLACFLPPMLARGHGRVLNVASIAAFQPMPTLATYAATKAYILSLTESLSEELKGKGVSVTALCPGLTATNMLNAMQQHEAQLTDMPGFLISDAAQVAAQGYAACIGGDVITVPGVLNLAATLAARSTPKWLVRRVLGAVGRSSIKH